MLGVQPCDKRASAQTHSSYGGTVVVLGHQLVSGVYTKPIYIGK